MRFAASGFAFLALTLPFAASADPSAGYAVGQVWSYKNRPADDGSLLRIAAIEGEGDHRIYHVSLIGVQLSCQTERMQAGHLPLSEQTMRSSLVEQVSSTTEFPDSAEGIAEWRRAEGGVFTISVAEVADVLDQTICSPDRVSSN